MSLFRLILWPSLVTLAITLLRLLGELRHWPELFFGRGAGGGNSLVGISWLALFLAVYFALRLRNLGQGPRRPGRAVLLTLIAIVIWIAGLGLVFLVGQGRRNIVALVGGVVVIIAALQVMRSGWPDYWRVMLVYALVARIPVILVMLAAIHGNWGTHYDVMPHTMQTEWSRWWHKFMDIGLLPQLAFWVPYTVLICGLLGVSAAAVRGRSAATSPRV